MKTKQLRIAELKEKANFGVKLCRTLLLLLLVSLIVNVVTIVQLHNISVQSKFEQTLMSTGTVEKIDNKTFRLLPDEDLSSYDLTPIPANLK